MEQSRWLIRCNHSDEIRMLGREGEGARVRRGSCLLVGTMTPKRQQEPNSRGKGKRQVNPAEG